MWTLSQLDSLQLSTPIYLPYNLATYSCSSTQVNQVSSMKTAQIRQTDQAASGICCDCCRRAQFLPRLHVPWLHAHCPSNRCSVLCCAAASYPLELRQQIHRLGFAPPHDRLHTIWKDHAQLGACTCTVGSLPLQASSGTLPATSSYLSKVLHRLVHATSGQFCLPQQQVHQCRLLSRVT